MKPQQFKNYLKANKSKLKGKSIMIIVNGLGSTYTTLRELGNRILEVERMAKGFEMDWGKMQISVDTGIDMGRGIAEFKNYKI